MNNQKSKSNETIPFKMGLKTIRNLKINLRGGTGNNKILMREIKEDLNQWRVLSCMLIRKLNY